MFNVDVEGSYHQAHIQNFFDAMRDDKVKLNCPADVAYETCVMVLTANEAVKAGKTIEFSEEDFKV